MPVAANYGRIGFIMGHELIHGFDNTGKEYNATGGHEQWWSTSVSHKYEKKAKCLADQYSKCPVVSIDGNKTLGYVNGNNTLGDNIADNSGLKLAYMAYQEAKAIDLNIAKLDWNDDQLFYISFAQTWCEKRTDDNAKNHLTNDPHSPGRWRTNIPVSNSKSFAKTFQCPIGSKMNQKHKCVVCKNILEYAEILTLLLYPGSIRARNFEVVKFDAFEVVLVLFAKYLVLDVLLLLSMQSIVSHDPLHTRTHIKAVEAVATQYNGQYENYLNTMVSYMDKSIDPCEDFYQYSCGGWLKLNAKADGNVDSSFHQVDIVNSDIIEKIMDSKPKFVADFLNSCLGEMKLNDAGVKVFEDQLDEINATKSVEELLEMAGKLFVQTSSKAFLSFAVVPDPKDQSVNLISLSQDGLSLSSIEYYDDQSTYSKIYSTFISALGATDLIKIDNANETASEVFGFESQLSKVSRTRSELLDPWKTYNKFSMKDFKAKYPLIAKYIGGINANLLSSNHEVLVESPEYFNDLTKLLKSTNLSTLKDYLGFHVMTSQGDVLGDDMRKVVETFTNALRGYDGVNEREDYCYSMALDYLGSQIGYLYYQKTFDESKLSAIQAYITEIEIEMKDVVNNAAWLDKTTRTAALEKISKVQSLIGGPKAMPPLSFPLNNTNFRNNMLKFQSAYINEMLSQLEKPTAQPLWTDPASTVNAFYYWGANQIVVPAGILQPPMFDSKNMPAAANYGRIGLIMGHELTHGFDSSGKNYDATGKLASWWSPSVLATYEKNAVCMANQYSKYPVSSFDGNKTLGYVNGNLTLSENIADNGGLKLAYLAYQRAKQVNASIGELEVDDDKVFYISFAQTWYYLNTMTLYLDTTIDPCDDFYQYSCGGWLKLNAQQEKDLDSSFDQAGVLNNKIIEKIMDEKTKLIADFLNSCNGEKDFNSEGLESLGSHIDEIANITSVEKLLELAGKLFVKTSSNAFFKFKVETNGAIFLSQDGLTLPSDYYADSNKYQKPYTTYLSELASVNVVGIDNVNATSSAILKFESQLAKVFLTEAKLQSLRYNSFTIKKFKAKYPLIAKYIDAIRSDILSTAEYIYVQPEYFDTLNELLQSTDLDILNSYLSFRVINGQVNHLGDYVRILEKSFYNAIYGNTQVQERQDYCHDKTLKLLKYQIGYLYYQKTFDKNKFTAIEQYIAEMKISMKSILNDASWLDKSTRTAALEKINQVRSFLGGPDSMPKLSFEMSSTDFRKNMLNFHTSRVNEMLSYLKKPVSPVWTETANTANAYYDPTKNSIIVPAGILQPPMFDSKNIPAAANYGRIGLIMGHELIHGFDNTGKDYNAKGEYDSWWSPNVLATYKKNAACMANQYSKCPVISFDTNTTLGYVNGNLTLGDDIADNGGLKLAHMAYQRAKQVNASIAKLDINDDQLFYISFAQTWCQKLTDSTAKCFESFCLRMGLFKELASALGMKKTGVRILVIGLDNSGKTTLVNHLKPRKSQTTEVVPTVGFQVEEFTKYNLCFTVFDMSGQSRYRSLWENYYQDVQAIIFVMDSTDSIRMCVVKDELEQIIQHKDLASKKIPILFFANKVLYLTEYVLILASNAITGRGVEEGIQWLADQLSKQKARK
ncbi:endothelin-converting enzyme 1, metalloprotease family M13 [Thraustotheca clavata]|uniref:Endothelin-converting enzyme 1, metalloprotease family M13 n=1 Tax=Thraustotheca clavata TaxID=74557 RepID=A0A1W0A1M7_9STRA|nr:endothelin-converting enzyme 1, metalloprotease family M13 [Thraustotheca clavata]